MILAIFFNNGNVVCLFLCACKPSKSSYSVCINSRVCLYMYTNVHTFEYASGFAHVCACMHRYTCVKAGVFSCTHV